MQRRLYEEHVRWTQDARRKPLVLEGARGTGKTWLVKELGVRVFENTACLDCEKLPRDSSLVTGRAKTVRAR